MGIEEDMFSAFKYAGFTGGMNPQQMIRGIVRNLEITLLRRMQKQIEARIGELGTTDEGLDPFGILGIDEDATKEEVTKAFREKAWTAHPDRGGSNEEMAKVNAAKEAIFLFRGWK